MKRKASYQRSQRDDKGPVAERFAREVRFFTRGSVRQIEEGRTLMPRFSRDGLLPCVTQDFGKAPLATGIDTALLRTSLCG